MTTTKSPRAMAAMALSIVSNAKAVRMGGGTRSFGARRGGEERSIASGVGRSCSIGWYADEVGMVSCVTETITEGK
jgi:hypothetical protein